MTQIGFKSTDSGEGHLAEVLERELPGFWAFFHLRHPEFKIGAPDKPPVGYIHAFQVHEAMAETIPAYVRALRNVE